MYFPICPLKRSKSWSFGSIGCVGPIEISSVKARAVKSMKSLPSLTAAHVEAGQHADAHAVLRRHEGNVHRYVQIAGPESDASGHRERETRRRQVGAGRELEAVRRSCADQPAETRNQHALIDASGEEHELMHTGPSRRAAQEALFLLPAKLAHRESKIDVLFSEPGADAVTQECHAESRPGEAHLLRRLLLLPRNLSLRAGLARHDDENDGDEERVSD